MARFWGAVDFSDLADVATYDDYKFDDVIWAHVKNSCVKKDADDRLVFPIVPDGGKEGIVLKYPVYRFAVGLPYFSRLTDVYRLPTVDHVDPSHGGRDSRSQCMRLATHNQNCHNACSKNTCQIPDKFHGVKGTAVVKQEIDAFKRITGVDDDWCYHAWEYLIKRAHLLDAVIINAGGNVLDTVKTFGSSAVEVINMALADTKSFKVPETSTRDGLDGEKYKIGSSKYTFKHALTAAVLVDILRVTARGEWAHCNILTRDPVSKTCDALPRDMLPADVMNMWERRRSNEDRVDMYAAVGIDATTSKVPFYYHDGPHMRMKVVNGTDMTLEDRLAGLVVHHTLSDSKNMRKDVMFASVHEVYTMQY
jgi:hypothetical protein